jgi:type IV pilus assembly protein PilP
MKPVLCALSLVVLVCGLNSCSSSDDQQDLRDFMAETKRRPHGQIDPLPAFKPFKPYAYSAMMLRSPFERPIPVDEAINKGGRTVEPDLTREREYLESFNIASLRMVGTLERSGKLWALIDDGEGKVTQVTTGNYMGRNYGKIIATQASQIEILEIVPDGANGWVERPKIIKLEAKE